MALQLAFDVAGDNGSAIVIGAAAEFLLSRRSARGVCVVLIGRCGPPGCDSGDGHGCGGAGGRGGQWPCQVDVVGRGDRG